MYHFVNASKIGSVFCQVCQVNRGHDHASSTPAMKFVSCPNPTFVKSFLQYAIGFKIHIGDGALLCIRRYKHTKCQLSNETILAELEEKEIKYMKLIK